MAKNGRVLAVLVGLSGPGEAWHWRGCGSPHLKRWMQQGPRPSAKPSKRWRQLASLWTGGAFGDFLSFWLLKCNPKIDSLGKKNQNASRWSKKSWFTPPEKKEEFHEGWAFQLCHCSWLEGISRYIKWKALTAPNAPFRQPLDELLMQFPPEPWFLQKSYDSNSSVVGVTDLVHNCLS